MARIRSIKPEFWDSPSVAKASPWARLLFIAMWNWADDYGRGTANPKELEGFAFPHDDEFTDSSGNTVHFRELLAEVAECFDVLFYTVEGRQYFAIPTWDDHQRNERRAKQSRYPDPPVFEPNFGPVAEIPSQGAEAPRSSGPGTGEQGNRGTGEQGSTPVGGEADSPAEQSSSFEVHVNDVTRDAYAAINKSANFMALRGIAKWCLKDRGIGGAEFRTAVVAIYGMGKPITKQTVGQFLDGYLGGRGSSARESRMQANLRLVDELAAESKGIEQ